MNSKNILKKGFVVCVVCILMLVYIPSINGASIDNQKNDILTFEKGVIKHGFIFGPFTTSYMEDDLLVLIGEWGYSPALELNIIVPFMRIHLNYLQQVKLVKFDNCIITKNFIIGFCKIYLTQTKISMHILSQNDYDNKTTWVVDEIIGDEIWEQNIVPDVYEESGENHIGWFQYGPIKNEYLSIGDQIHIMIDVDGYYTVKFIDSITREILFTTPLVKY